MDWQELSQQDNLHQHLIKLIQKLSSLSSESCQRIQNEKDFIRLLCLLDDGWTLDTAILIFLAKEIYKSNHNIHDLSATIQEAKKKYQRPPSDIKSTTEFLRSICSNNIKNITIGLKVSQNEEIYPVNIEVQSQEDIISFDLKEPDEEIDTLETCNFDSENGKVKELAQTLRQVFSKEAKWNLYAKSTVKWTQNTTRSGYIWLKEKQFFQPEIKKASVWAWGKYQTGQNWLLYKQEIYVLLKNKDKKNGYAAILAHKYIKIKLRIHKKQYQSLTSCKPAEFFRILKGILTSSKLSLEEREVLTQLKESILIHEKMLLQPATTLDAINYGFKKFKSILQRVSHITNKRKMNRQIYDYLFIQIDSNLQNHHLEFRKNLEKKYRLCDLEDLLSQYCFTRLTMMEHYQELQIIHKVKCITREYKQKPHDLISILNKYLGTNGEANVRKKLPEILYTNNINQYILEKISDERYLENIQKTLQHLQKTPDYKRNAASLYQLIDAFFKAKGKFSFSEFKTSLNFIPQSLQRKILTVIKKELQEKLNIRINTIISQEGRYLKRYDELLNELESLQYEGANVFVYKISPQDLAQRIKSITYNENSIDRTLEHTFGQTVPASFTNLIKRAKSAQDKSKEKNMFNCLRILSKIEKMLERKETVNMSRVLTSLFQQHGTVNFSVSNEEINGYQVAHFIGRFYNNPQRTIIELPITMDEEIKNKLKLLIDTHRNQQLKKIGN